MSDDTAPRRLRRPEASAAVEHLGWRYLLARFHTGVAVGSPAEAADVTATAVRAAGPADGHLRADLRPGRVLLSLQDPALADVTSEDVEAAARITTVLRATAHTTSSGLTSDRAVGPQATDPAVATAVPRAEQSLEIAIDALDIPAVRPFWKAVLAYTDEPGQDGPADPLVDPLGQGPAVWFQQMEAPRPQRNRIHFDISVPHDEAQRRLAAALYAGGRLVNDGRAPAFWVLADPEGNEICICTWQGRD
ncbi:4a-hydroxytetrahydrobiopterin dehydratase [Jiangella aurantiaca]|uniref:4a-hydroxytetrahydrobiopterin dehydratase n=1 Tax=Jiangella aurantiaca TaxID=2530373 RepID=A0A4R5AC86_9ACTN|nr:VOC family protein [Jiangella aurantiaca]TDD68639.1 4a-hydroxytetrahydrobiopterin dehydratase [Jiangella aurantiaca]